MRSSFAACTSGALLLAVAVVVGGAAWVRKPAQPPAALDSPEIVEAVREAFIRSTPYRIYGSETFRGFRIASVRETGSPDAGERRGRALVRTPIGNQEIDFSLRRGPAGGRKYSARIETAGNPWAQD